MIPKGLTNALSTFQHFMNEVFSDLINISVVVYLDNILIYSNNLAEHRKHVKEVHTPTAPEAQSIRLH